MSEETDALSNRVRQLENQVADMQRLVQDTSDLLDIARANGLDKFLTGHGLVEFGSGHERLDSNGIQIKVVPTLWSNISFLETFVPTITVTTTQASVTAQFVNHEPDISLLLIRANGSTGPAYEVSASGGASSTDVHTWSTSLAAVQLYDRASDSVFDFSGGTGTIVNLGLFTVDASSPFEGMLLARSDTHKARYYNGTAWDNLATESYVTKESASAAAIATNGTITTASVTSARVAPTGAVTGVILQSGTTGGQVCTVVNEAVAANTVTFAASGTSNVADGTSSVIAGLTARRFVWDSGTSLWYPCK